tara:strand:+ start:911 stop:2308 length:1398 start_codon:yes stop_codon:yes gene_type:complete
MTILKIQNTLENSKEVFDPIDSKNVRVYACGPTVYNYAHIGNARMAVVNDVLIRLLRLIYPKVTYVSNITDIDDKIIESANNQNIEIKTLTRKFEKIYNEDMSALGVENPDKQPRASEHINEMIELTKKLLDNKNAYEKDGHVLFHVPSFKNYGCLSKRNREEQIMGSRVEVAPFKKDPTDFVLWKPSSKNMPGWDSPWGFGRPGWHLECSAMSEKTLGLPFDIHSGGMDLTFPHHENEIAQTCSAHNQNDNPKFFAKYWFHNGFVIVDGEKMSKSIGNIRLVNDLIKRYSGETLRLTLLSAHYRQPLNWTTDSIDQTNTMLTRLYRSLHEIKNIKININKASVPENVMNALCDDLNTPKALAELNLMVNKLSGASLDEQKKLKEGILASGKVIGILQNNPEKWLRYGIAESLDNQSIKKLIKDRNEARRKKDFALADKIRNELKNKGIEIEDTKEGTLWRSIKN